MTRAVEQAIRLLRVRSQCPGPALGHAIVTRTEPVVSSDPGEPAAGEINQAHLAAEFNNGHSARPEFLPGDDPVIATIGAPVRFNKAAVRAVAQVEYAKLPFRGIEAIEAATTKVERRMLGAVKAIPDVLIVDEGNLAC